MDQDRTGTDLLFLTPCSSILRKGLSLVAELKHAVYIRSFLRWYVSCMDIHDCEDVPQFLECSHWLSDEQPAFHFPQSPIISLSIRSVGQNFPSVLFVLSSVAYVEEQEDKPDFFPQLSLLSVCTYLLLLFILSVLLLLSFQFCVRRNTEWDDCLIFYHSSLSACSFCVRINLTVSLLNYSFPDCSLSRLFINHSRPSGGGVLRSTSFSPLLLLKTFRETLIITHLVCWHSGIPLLAVLPIPFHIQLLKIFCLLFGPDCSHI